MGTVILLRHAKSVANGSGILAGRTEGIGLDETGRAQAAALVDRLASVPLAALVHSPLQRCVETLRPLAEARGIEPVAEPELSEVDYGEWTGGKLAELVKEPLWPVVQAHPSAAVFPGGEGLAEVQARSVAAARGHDRRIAAASGQDEPVWLLCSHGDVIKSIIADALGQHLDGFQRIVVDPGSISVVRYTPLRSYLVRMNDGGDNLARIAPTPGAALPGEEAPVGGTTGN